MTAPPLSPLDPQALLAAVLQANASTAGARLRHVLDAAIRHLHAFALEVDLTPAELQAGLDFLVAVGQASGPKKHEGILLADILGLATLVQLRQARHAMEAGGTEPALIGPFWRADQPLRRNGERICSDDTPGARLTVLIDASAPGAGDPSAAPAWRRGRPRPRVCTRTRTRPRRR